MFITLLQNIKGQDRTTPPLSKDTGRTGVTNTMGE